MDGRKLPSASKTEVFITGPEHTYGQVLLVPALGTCSGAQYVVPTAKNFGLILDQNQTIESHVKRLAQPYFFHLRNILRIKSFITFNDLQRVIHAFITSHLDFCNVMFTYLGQNMIAQLQGIQNAAARL